MAKDNKKAAAQPAAGKNAPAAPTNTTAAAASAGKKSSKSSLLVSVLTIVVGIAYMLVVPGAPSLALEGASGYPVKTPTYTLTGAIPRTHWAPKKAVVSPLMANATAHIASNTFISSWPAARKWDLYGGYLPGRLPPVLTNVQRSNTPHVGPAYRTHKPFSRLPGAFDPHPHELVHVGTRAFFDKITGRAPAEPAANRTWLSWTGELHAPFLLKELEPWRELIPRAEGQRVALTVAEGGVRHHLRAETTDTFVAQLQGYTRVRVFPPAGTAAAPLFPSLHPSFGFAQPYLEGAPSQDKIDQAAPTARPFAALTAAAKSAALTAADKLGFAKALGWSAEQALPAASTEPVIPVADCALPPTAFPPAETTPQGQAALFPTLSALKGLEAVLAPGELLYVPPQWLLETEALGPTLSVSFQSAALAQKHYDKALKAVMTGAIHDWTMAQKRTAAALMLHGMLTEQGLTKGVPMPPLELGDGNDTFPRRFIAHHVAPRYARLIASGALSTAGSGEDGACDMAADLTIPNASPTAHGQMLQVMGVVPQDVEVGTEDPPTNEEIYEGLARLSTDAAKALFEIPQQTRHVWLANLVETLAFWAADAADGSDVAHVIECIAALHVDVSRG